MKILQMKYLSILMPLGFGATLINTMPVWLAELAEHPQVSAPIAGGLGSLVLLTAALACLGPSWQKADGAARLVIPVALCLLAVGPAVPVAVVGLTCVLLGVALGLVTQQALRDLRGEDAVLSAVSTAITFGLGVSFVIYVTLYSFPLRVLWILAAASVSLSVFRPEHMPETVPGKRFGLTPGLPLGYFPFFVMMGAYWSFLELYGQSVGAADGLTLWLLVSLLSGAIGSFLAGLLAQDHWRKTQIFALLAAAIAGALSYFSPNLITLGITILANGFFLFLFFPIYLASHRDQAPTAMGVYLLGFAFGGLAGAIVLQFAGYPGLGLAIVASGVIAVCWDPNRFHNQS